MAINGRETNLGDAINLLEDLFTNCEAEINSHSLLQIVETAYILERISELRKRGIMNLLRSGRIFLSGPGLPLALGSSPSGIDADNRGSRSAVSLAVGGGSGGGIGG